jgi:two-component system, sensor histidine kinase and response regulator
MTTFVKELVHFNKRIKSIGFTTSMDDYEKRRLGIFNRINFLGLITGIVIPFAALFGDGYVPLIAWVVAIAPFFISSVVLISNYYYWHNFAMMWYFITYPIITCLVYAGNIDVGIELLFVLYGVFAVFFLQKISHILFAICFSVACYLVVVIGFQDYKYVLAEINFTYYIINQFISLAFIFVGLVLIKKENTGYQKEMLYANWELKNINEDIYKQGLQLEEKAAQLEEQTLQLVELNAVKNRLFSVVSHDLKTPVYSLRNLFKGMHESDLPATEVKLYVPEILADLNYTISLMENLLQWAKSQMQGDSVNQQLIDIGGLMKEVKQSLRLQAENKKIYVNTKADKPIYIYADKDMMNLVLLNLVSNAIKFTPENGEVSVSALVKDETVEVQVQDTGKGISSDNMEKLFSNSYFTTKGTANESGTGLGLMLCKEFVTKNGGEIFVESEEGKGSTFTFTIPKA